MSPHRRRFPLPITSFALALLLAAGCSGQDFLDSPLGIDELDHGWRVGIEPGEQFGVELTGNAIYPATPWQIAEFDSAVIEFRHEEHEIPRPPSGDPEATEGGLYDPGSLTSRSGYTFAGVALGETALRFEFVVDGERIDIAEYEVAVVEDSCEVETAAVANRCGGDFSYHPQDGLVEWDHGQRVALEPRGESRVTLTANALYPDIPWQIVEFDSSIVAVDGPHPLGAARSSGDWSEVDPFTSHSFLQAWSFTIRGVALGESPVVLAISVDSKHVDLFETTIVVVENADAFGEVTSSTAVEEAAQGTHTGEVFLPAVDPEVVFTGPLTTSAGSFVIRYESNFWYRESGIATLPSVGDLQWFLDTEDGCLAVDRSAFIDGTGQGHEIMITPVADGEISIGESIPLWIEGDWLIHDGCSRDDPIIHQSQ